MFERFVKEARTVVTDAEAEARALESPTIEAEHLLLALTRQEGTAVREVLVAAGLDHDGVQAALDTELERSLLAVGVSASDFDVARDVAPRPTRPRFAASAKLALERALRVAQARQDRRIESAHVLLGILRAEAGTVPRALAAADVDRQELAAAVAATIAPR